MRLLMRDAVQMLVLCACSWVGSLPPVVVRFKQGDMSAHVQCSPTQAISPPGKEQIGGQAQLGISMKVAY